MEGKRLIDNILKHQAVHNRVVEEEQCWRELELQKSRRNRERKLSTPNEETISQRRILHIPRKSTSGNRTPSPLRRLIQQKLDAYERKLRMEMKRSYEMSRSSRLPSAAGGKGAKDFWGGLANRADQNDRWGHDGWDELQRASEPEAISIHSASFDSSSRCKRRRTSCSESSSTSSTPGCSVVRKEADSLSPLRSPSVQFSLVSCSDEESESSDDERVRRKTSSQKRKSKENRPVKKEVKKKKQSSKKGHSKKKKRIKVREKTPSSSSEASASPVNCDSSSLSDTSLAFKKRKKKQKSKKGRKKYKLKK